MHKHIVLAALIAFGLALSAHAQTAPAPATTAAPAPVTSAAPVATTEQPWAKAQAVLDATQGDFDKSGIMAIGPHVTDLEQVLSEEDKAFAAAGSSTGAIIVLTDGPADTLITLMAASSNKDLAGRQVTAVNDPYPAISLFLGSYYNETGKPDEALRVLGAGLAVYEKSGAFGFGEHQPLLISERGAALISLARWADALANYDDGLALTGVEDKDRARLYRGRGYALTELGRLDEAEQAYKDSLKLDPDNKIALGELDYIARLRAGGTKEQGGITLPSNTK